MEAGEKTSALPPAMPTFFEEQRHLRERLELAQPVEARASTPPLRTVEPRHRLDGRMLCTQHHDMRTTLTLEDDVVEKLKREMHRRGTSFEETVNQCLRRGLEEPRPENLTRPFRVEPRSLGLRPGVQLDDVAGLLDALDGPRLIVGPVGRHSLLEVLSRWAPLDEELPDLDDLEPIEDVDL